ncbi:MAG: hypothetical protein WKF43_10385 [Acidimicrobiales bacterium]
MADANGHTLPLGHDFALICSSPVGGGTVRVRLSWRGRDLFDRSFTADQPHAEIGLSLPTVRADGMVELDPFAGELRLAAHLAVRHRRNGGDASWKDLIDPDRVIVIRFDPSIGEVGGSTAVHEPIVDDPRFGRSQLSTPVVLRIHVAEDDRVLADVGRIVKSELFTSYPPFTFNTVACVGAAADGAPGAYGDPESIWFNVFFGYYQVDCSKSRWSRPFGYRSAAGAASVPATEDVLRLGKADWNWFSNWMYGVPERVLYPYSRIDKDPVGIVIKGPTLVGASRWHHLRLSGVAVASCYEADRSCANRLERNTPLQTVWRHAFGMPHLRVCHPVSFVPTDVDAALDMAYWEDDTAYHTVMFGGTAQAGSDPGFLDAQVAATRAIIEEDYPALGFA